MVKKRDATMAEINDQNDDFKVAKVLQREPSEDIYEMLDDHYETIAIKDEYIALMEKAIDAKDELIAIIKKVIGPQSDLILKLLPILDDFCKEMRQNDLILKLKPILDDFGEEMNQIIENDTRRIALRKNNNDGGDDNTNE